MIVLLFSISIVEENSSTIKTEPDTRSLLFFFLFIELVTFSVFKLGFFSLENTSVLKWRIFRDDASF